MKTLSAFVFGLVICICSQSIAQNDSYFRNQNFYGSENKAWTLNTSLLVLDLEDSANNNILIQNTTTGDTVLSAGQLSALDTGVGVDASLHHHAPTGIQHEFRSIYVSHDSQGGFQDMANLTNVFEPLLPSDFILLGPNILDVFSIEFNRKTSPVPGVTFFAGPRFVSVYDQVNVFTRTLIPVPPGPGPPGPPTSFQTESEFTVKNSLFGGQLGSNLNLTVTRNVQLNGSVRAGYYANPTKYRMITSSSLTPGVVTDVTVKETNDALAAEVFGNVVWEIFPGAMSVEAGYHAMWMDGIGRSFGQLVNNTTDIATDTLFWQGLRVGIIYKR